MYQIKYIGQLSLGLMGTILHPSCNHWTFIILYSSDINTHIHTHTHTQNVSIPISLINAYCGLIENLIFDSLDLENIFGNQELKKMPNEPCI